MHRRTAGFTLPRAPSRSHGHVSRCPLSCGKCGRRSIDRAAALPDDLVDSRGQKLPFHMENGVIVDSRGRPIPMPADLESKPASVGIVAGLAIGGLCIVVLAVAVALAVAVHRRRGGACTNARTKAEMGAVAAADDAVFEAI